MKMPDTAASHCRTRRGQPARPSLARACAPVLFILTLALSARPADPPTASRPSQNRPQLEDFQILSERNIFNPNRGPRQVRTERPPTVAQAPRTETLALLGTLGYEKGWFAVFGGSEPGFRQLLSVSDSIAGCKIQNVEADYVELEQDGQKLRLQVGMKMERKGEGQWNLAGTASRAEERATLTAAVTNRSDTSSEDDDVLKRLLEKREREMNNEN